MITSPSAAPAATVADPATAPAPKSVGAALTAVLLDEPAAGHEHWAHLVSGPGFAHRPGLGHDERIELAYERLRLVNASVADPLALAADVHRLAALHEWTGVVDASLTTVAGIHYNLFLGSLHDHDDDPSPRHRRHLADLAAMRRIGTFLCTELDHGNDAGALETTATLDRATGTVELHTPHPGARKYMPNTSSAGGPKSAVVAARLLADGQDHGVFLLLVELADEDGPRPGITVELLPARTGSPVDHCLTTFDRLRLPASALLGGDHGRLAADGSLTSAVGSRRKRFLRSIGRVTEGKLCMSASGVGVSRAALAIAVRYAGVRHISGTAAGSRVPLAAHRSHTDRLLTACATVYAMTFLHRAATRAWAGRTPEGRARTERLVAVTKAWTTWQARDVLIECRERCGAQGLFPANGLAEFPLDIEGAITAEGDNLAVWVKSAAEHVFDHEEHRPVRSSGAGDLLDDPYALRDLLAADEARLRARAAAALRSGPAGDPLARWNHASPAAQDALGAYALVQAADAFLDAVGAVGDPQARALLADLCRLFLLQHVHPRGGDLAAAGLLPAGRLGELPAAIEALRVRLTPDLGTLTDAFGLPEALLARIPILGPDRAGRVPRPGRRDPVAAVLR